MEIQSFYLVETKPMPIYENNKGEKFCQLYELLTALFENFKISNWVNELQFAYGVDIISFKYKKTDKQKEFLFPLSHISIFQRMFPNNPILRELVIINGKFYKKEKLYLVQDFCDFLKESHNISFTRNKMFQLLRENGYLEKIDSDNVPTDLSNQLSLFQVVSNIKPYEHCGGTAYLHFNTPYLTEQGKQYLTSCILKYVRGEQ